MTTEIIFEKTNNCFEGRFGMLQLDEYIFDDNFQNKRLSVYNSRIKCLKCDNFSYYPSDIIRDNEHEGIFINYECSLF